MAESLKNFHYLHNKEIKINDYLRCWQSKKQWLFRASNGLYMQVISPGGYSRPLRTGSAQISSKRLNSPPSNHIYSGSLCQGTSNGMQVNSPEVVLSPSNRTCPDILKAVEIPTHKPYTFLFRVSRGIKWYVDNQPRGQF